MLYYRRHKSPHKDHCSTLVGTGATGVMSFVSTKWVWPEFISVSACINCDLRRSNIRQMISTFYILPNPPCPKMPSEQALDSLTIKGPKQQIHSKSYADSVPAKVDVTKPWPQLLLFKALAHILLFKPFQRDHKICQTSSTDTEKLIKNLSCRPKWG